MSDSVDIRQMALGFWQSRVLFSAHRIRLFEQLESHATAPQLSRKLGLDLRAIDILLEALVSLGLVRRKKDGSYVNAPIASLHLVSGGPGYMGNILDHYDGMWESWSRLDAALSTGKPQPSDRGRDLEAFILGMHNIARERAPRVVACLPLKGVRRILDLGGGPGTYAMEMARVAKNSDVVLFDRPGPGDIAERLMREEGLGDRVRILSGDILTDDFGRGYDLIFFSNVIHSYGPEENRKALRKVANALLPGGCVAVHDFYLGENPWAGLFGVNMLVHTEHGRTYGIPEVRTWLDGAGLSSIRKVRVDEVSSLVLARKGAGSQNSEFRSRNAKKVSQRTSDMGMFPR